MEKDTNYSEEDIQYDDYPILRHIQNSVIGNDLIIQGPYGARKVVYCDYTASGRCLSFIEDFIRNNILPVYANTHSITGYNALQTTALRVEARKIIRHCVNASKNDVVIFTGSGATAAFHKLAWALKINLPRVAEETVVFLGPFEHHSNILLWRDYRTRVVMIRIDKNGYADLNHLEEELKFWRERRQHLLVAMSAASNVTGILTDTDRVSDIAHKYGAFALFDFASGGPYLKIDMNPKEKTYKDAVILSPHKFVGGPGTPGVLICKKWIFRNPVPDRSGGGTVDFVTRTKHVYRSDIEEIEEGGTPDIIGSIRAGMVFQLKDDVGTDVIHKREEQLCRKAMEKWESNPHIIVFGSSTAKRIPIFSFATMHLPTGRLVHYNFIATLLNDLFGIQSRGGCACAGPYGMDLFGLTEISSKKFLRIYTDAPEGYDKAGRPKRTEILKPGFTRLNLPYFFDDETIDYIIEAVDMVTKHGWKLLPQYTYDIFSGSWLHKEANHSDENISLKDINYHRAGLPNIGSNTKTKNTPTFKEVLRKAQKLFREAETTTVPPQISSDFRNKLRFRWFVTPLEAAKVLAAEKDKLFQTRRRYRLPFKFKQEDVVALSSGNTTDRSSVSDAEKSLHSKDVNNNIPEKETLLPPLSTRDRKHSSDF